MNSKKRKNINKNIYITNLMSFQSDETNLSYSKIE